MNQKKQIVYATFLVFSITASVLFQNCNNGKIQSDTTMNVPTGDSLTGPGYLADTIFNNDTAQVFTGNAGSNPFSFNYGGKSFSNWTYIPPTTAAPFSWAYQDPSKVLEVKITMVQYPEFGALKWHLNFKNIGNKVSEVISDVHPANLGLIDPDGRAENYTLKYFMGSLNDTAQDGHKDGVSDFTPVEKLLSKSGSEFILIPSQGRSSSGVMPYFNIQKPKGGGLLLAIGWSGQWMARFGVDQSGTNIGFRAGQETFKAQLRPGESIRTPAILLLPWKKTSSNYGFNSLRQLMLKHFSPLDSKGNIAEAVAAATNGAINVPWSEQTETNLLDMVRGVKESGIPFNTIWSDAGWYKLLTPKEDSALYNNLKTSSANNLWLTGAGDWTADPKRYPNGYRAISDAAHQAGYKSLLWFEPERLSVPSSTFKEFMGKSWALTDPTPNGFNPHLFGLTNFSDGTIVEYMIQKISQRLTEDKIDIYRQDMNVNQILNYWTLNDKNQSSIMSRIERAGMTEAGYIEGLYRFWDGLRQRHPGLLIDNCASGGRRLDFEAMSRSVPLWRSDRVWDPIEQQNQMMGLSHIIPQQGRGTDPGGIYKIRSGYGWTMSFAFDWARLDPNSTKALRKEVGALFGNTSPLGKDRPLSKVFLGDYYPMDHEHISFPKAANKGTIPDYNSDLDRWVGWQFHRQDWKAGLIQVFRRSVGALGTMNYVFKGLNPKITYILIDLDTLQKKSYPGKFLLSQGLPVSCPDEACAKVYTYNEIGLRWIGPVMDIINPRPSNRPDRLINSIL